LAMTCLYVAAFFIVDHHLQRKKEPRHTDPLLACVESSLIQVNHQIGLLKNVFWWYLLPPGAGIALFLFVVNWHLFKVLSAKLVLFECLVVTLIVVLVFWGVYLLNRRAVRKDLMPRKQELESLLNSLTNDSKMTQ
jgi:Flp pilus assembly protein TadB